MVTGLAADLGLSEICELLVQHGFDVNFGGPLGKIDSYGDTSGQCPLFTAASRGDLDTVRVLVKSKAKLDVTYQRG